MSESGSQALDGAKPEEGSKSAAKDHPHGYIGWVYADVFKELYQANPADESVVPDGAPNEEQPEDGEDPDGTSAPVQDGSPDDGEIDLKMDDDEINAIQADLADEQARLERILEQMASTESEARALDRKDAEFLQSRWGLVMKEQVPVPMSKLRNLLDAGQLQKEGLVHPRGMMEDMERYFEIKKGTIPHHDNLLAISKPEEPNHFKETHAKKIRMEVSGIKPTLTEEQRATIASELEERFRRRPRMPAGLNAEEKAKNREIVRRMQTKVNFLKNPRFLAEKTAKDKGESCPFWITPERIVFEKYEVGGLYEVKVEFRNCTGIGRRLRVLPTKNPAFSIGQLEYDKKLNSARPELAGNDPLAAVVAPGMAAHLYVQFAPSTLNDENERLTIATEVGDWELPLLSRRVQPKLDFQDPLNCGCMLAGNTITESVRIKNIGGEGAFRLVVSDDSPEKYTYETNGGDTTLICGQFRITPASFYMDANSATNIQVDFSASEVGRHQCPLHVECDNGERTPLTLVAIADAVRLELSRWPTQAEHLQPLALDPGSSVWSLVPWQLNWTLPGTQVGHSGMQSIEIANGGYLPMKVEWVLARPPRQLLSRLAVGMQNRLTDDMMAKIQDWKKFAPSEYGTPPCPFTVQPPSMMVPPFSTAQFSFSFKAHPPVGAVSMAFAYLVVKELPDSSECLLPYTKMLELQGDMQPEEYRKGLPLFGGVISKPFDRALRNHSTPGSQDATVVKNADPKDCCVSRAVTAVCLKGITTKPAVSVLPSVLALAGDVLPFVSNTREIKLRNSGSMPAYFRVRLTSTMHAADANSIDPIWVVSMPEVGPRPQDPQPDRSFGNAELDSRLLEATRLSSQWPPLPPEEGARGAAQMPGYGALASCAVEPHEGRIPAGGTVTIRVTLRAVRESDLDGQLVIDLPVSAESNAMALPSIKVNIIAAVRSPRVEVRNTSYLDYGVVRAHDKHKLNVQLDNPSNVPVLVQLRQHKEDQKRANFPVKTHRQIIGLFMDAAERGMLETFMSLDKNVPESVVEPWVHSRSGCLDKSGRRKYATHEVSGDEQDGIVDGVPDSEDFICKPGFVILWPHQRTEVEVTLRTREVGRYRTLLEAVSFDSLNIQCLEVLAEVQLPQVRLNTQHAHFDVTYLRTASDPFRVELRNDSDMAANFFWTVPQKLEACLQCQIDPPMGSIPPRGRLFAFITTVPTREDDDPVIAANLFVEDVLQPLELRVTAVVYGCEVDYAVVEPGQLPPEIIHLPRQVGDSPMDPAGTYQVTVDKAPRLYPIVDFGEMELQKAKTMQVVLYNRTGIATPFGVQIDKNPAYDPLVKGRKVGDLLDAATRMYAMITKSGEGDGPPPDVPDEQPAQTFESSPQPAGAGRDLGEATMEATAFPSAGQNKASMSKRKNVTGTLGKSKKAALKKRRWLLDDKHERQAFRSSVGAAFAKQKEMQEAGKVALKAGRGFAVRVNPSSDWLQPFGTATITLTCFSDLPGIMDDVLVLTIRECQGHTEGRSFRIPLRLRSVGNPLFLPDQQVGLNILSTPPRLFCGVTVPVEKHMMRRFKVGNSSSTQIVISWKIFPKRQLENTGEDRQLVRVALCGRKEGVEDPFVEQGAVQDKTKDPLQLDIEELKADKDDDDDDIDPETPFSFKIWAQDPPPVEDPFALNEYGDLPVIVEPREAVLPVHGTATFQVNMTCLKATLAAAGHYRYTLIGTARFTQDREKRLAYAQENPGKEYVERPPSTVYKSVSVGDQVANLPDMKTNDLMDDDSDAEMEDVKPGTAAGPMEAPERDAPGTTTTFVSRARARASILPPAQEPLAKEPEQDVISTIVIDCVGDCILPRLVIDKKGNPGVEEFEPQNAEADQVGDTPQAVPIINAPVFKFTMASVPPAGAKDRSTGATHGGLPGGCQIPGVTSCLVRQVTLSNHNASTVACRFKIVGPYRIRQIQQAGNHPVQLVSDGPSSKKKGKETASADPEAARQLFSIAKWETITLQVEFMPDWIPASEWEHLGTKSEHIFKGDLIVEYPREKPDVVTSKKDDLQRIHLVGTAKRPAVRVHVVPNELDRQLRLERAEKPPWSEPMPLVVEFGFTHIDSSITRTRTILISNISSIIARWSLMHVGRKRRPPHVIGCTLPEEEDFRALDDKDAFEFDISGGELPGPSKDGLVLGSEDRLPHWCAKSSALPRALPFGDERRFEPQQVKISFRPKKNELYKCKFRIQVDNGLAIDFICRGCGSYDEEDDNFDFHEA
eukprot:TRINITY_DN21698_c0_g1_i1.p1 TRINITY_DN21698_c0_g1~~TRINITY_DN21698_c0_g1_i1.p1  ORF type:complete len:2245 (+),score=433.56 TRINITY_DN21698_c0_g1_i1:107-6841(+)